jgi:chromosome segregation ATPase
MELIVILLSSISGALIGTSVGIYLLYRKLRPITGAELDLTRGKLRSTEFSLSSTTASLDNVRKQLEEREQTAGESKRLVAAAEEKVRQMEAEVAAVRQQFGEVEARGKDETKAVAESASRQIAGYEARIDADERQIQELNGQVARLTAELAQIKEHYDQESQNRTVVDTQLSAELERSRQLASRIADLESQRSHFDLTLQEERQSAAKGIELLLMAQENLSRIFKPATQDLAGDTNGHVLVGTAAGNGDELSHL